MLTEGHLYLFVPKPYCCVGPDESGSKSSCTTCTLRFLRSVRLALVLLTTINRGVLKCSLNVDNLLKAGCILAFLLKYTGDENGCFELSDLKIVTCLG